MIKICLKATGLPTVFAGILLTVLVALVGTAVGVTQTPGGSAIQPPQSSGGGASQGAAAPQSGASGSQGTQTGSDQVQGDQKAAVKVIDVYRLGSDDVSAEHRNAAGIYEIIQIKVRNLPGLLDKAQCLDDNKQMTQDCRDKIGVFFDKRLMNNIKPEAITLEESGEGTLQFHLDRSEESDEAWADLLGDPSVGGEKFFKRPTEVSVGLVTGFPEATDIIASNRFQLIRVHKIYFWISTILLAACLYALIVLAIRSDILRDGGPPPETGKRKPYSLARFQMAFWFVLVVASFIYIYIITGSDIIPDSVLGLIGIGAGTALGSAAIDSSKRGEGSGNLSELRAKKQTLQQELASVDSQITASPPPTNLTDLKDQRAETQKQLEAVNRQISDLTRGSKGFLQDIMSDTDGVSFHRFQMFIWTLVLGLMFFDSVWSRLAMPNFDTTLLALQGISSGTYLGFKIPEKAATPTS